MSFVFAKAGQDTNIGATLQRGFEQETGVSDALKAGFGAGFKGEGSYQEDLAAYEVSRELGVEPTFLQKSAALINDLNPFAEDDVVAPSQPLSKEDYEQSDFFREDLDYLDGMTERAARIRAEQYDARTIRNRVYAQQSGVLGKATFFASALAGGVADIKGLIAGAAAGAAVGGVLGGGAATAGRVVNKATKVWQVTRGGKAAIIAAEASLGAVPQIVGGLQNEAVLQTDYTIGDAFVDLAAASVVSVGLHLGGKGVARAYRYATTPKQKAEVVNTMSAQIANREPVDVAPIMEAQMSERVPTLTTVEAEATPTVRTEAKTGDYLASFQNERGLLSGVSGRGKTPDEAIENLRTLYEDGDVEALSKMTGVPANRLQQVREAEQVDRLSKDFDEAKYVEENAERFGVDPKRLAELEAKVTEAQKRLKEAEQASKKAPSNANVKRELTNAKIASTKAKNAADAYKREKYEPAVQEAQVVRQQLDQQAQQAKQVVRDTQSAEASAKLKEYADRQLSEQPPQDDFDQAVEEYVATAAERKDADLFTYANEARALLEEVAQSETASKQTKRAVERDLQNIDQMRLRAKELLKYIKCRGGG